MTDRIDGLPDEILAAILTQIQAEVPQLGTPGRCFLSLHPERTPGAAAGEYFCVVAPLAGTFAKGFWDGGDAAQCTVEAGFVTRVYSTTQIDPALRDGLFLTDASRGIFQVATNVLQSLVGFNPLVNGNFVTRDPIAPTSFDVGRNDRSLGWIELRFKLVFDWSLN